MELERRAERLGLRAARPSQVLALPISDVPARKNYVLAWPDDSPPSGDSFILFGATQLAVDKREMARVFALLDVPTPETLLLDTEEELQQVPAARRGEE